MAFVHRIPILGGYLKKRSEQNLKLKQIAAQNAQRLADVEQKKMDAIKVAQQEATVSEKNLQ
ncbi:MAG: hypothetical protein V1847_04815, partial [Candidatus Diapherotrites archaeon]